MPYEGGNEYDRYMGRWSRRLAPLFLDFAGVDGVDRVLDVGCGTGSLTDAIVTVSKASRIVGIDPVQDFVRYARVSVTDPRVRFTEGSAQRLPFPDSDFDACLSLLVIHNISDPAQAVREMCRVTRPGGLVAACEWDLHSGMDMFRVVWDALVDVDPSAAPKHIRHTPYGDRGQIAQLWKDCGIQDVEESSLTIPLNFASFDDFWAPFPDSPSTAVTHVRKLPPEARQRFHTQLKTALFSGEDDGPITLHARAWTVRGRVA